MIIIIGKPAIHTKRLAKKINSLGEKVFYFDTKEYPQKIKIVLSEHSEKKGYLMHEFLQEKFYIEDVKAAYLYCYEDIKLPEIINNYEEIDYYKQNIESVISSFLLNMECLWVNHPECIFMHQFKGNQLRKIAQTGLKIPDTLITNDKKTIIDFFDKHSDKVILKPLTGGLTEILKKKDLTEERMKYFSKFPVQFQEFIEGRDIRVHVLDKETFPSEIKSKMDNYKTDPNMDISRVDLDNEILQKCVELAENLNLKLAGIDFRITPEGECIFFEANPSPRFFMYEDKCNYPISDKLAKMLCS